MFVGAFYALPSPPYMYTPLPWLQGVSTCPTQDGSFFIAVAYKYMYMYMYAVLCCFVFLSSLTHTMYITSFPDSPLSMYVWERGHHVHVHVYDAFTYCTCTEYTPNVHVHVHVQNIHVHVHITQNIHVHVHVYMHTYMYIGDSEQIQVTLQTTTLHIKH